MKLLMFMLFICLLASCESEKSTPVEPQRLRDLELFDTMRFAGKMSFRSTELNPNSDKADTVYRDTFTVVKVASDSVYCMWNYPYDSANRFVRHLTRLPLRIQPIDLYFIKYSDAKENSFLRLLILNGRIELTDTIELKRRKIRRAEYFEGKTI